MIKIFRQKNTKIMAPEEILVSLVSEWSIFVVNLERFASSLYHFHLCGSGSVFGKRIRIHKVPEKGSNLAPDPQNWFYSNAMFLFLMSFFLSKYLLHLRYMPPLF